ncbi:MAG: hypothetical protein KDI76_10820 [Xanthomonadales bacterium]|nr:hypothetical protein [Xanthomonadales bacterium]
MNSKQILSKKLSEIRLAIEEMLEDKAIKHKVWNFGAYDIDPKYLVIVVGTETEIQKQELRSDKSFNESLKNLLEQFDWPEAAREHVVFSIESQEAVDKQSNGNWWYHYK